MREPLSARRLDVVPWDGPLEPLASEWSALVDPHHPGAAFRSFPWVSCWWNGASALREARLLLAKEQDRTVGILPLYAEPLALGGRRLRLMGDDIVGSDFLGAIARPGDAPAVARAFADHLHDAGFDELQLDDLLPEDPLLQALREDRAHAFQIAPRYRCPFVRLAGEFDDYLAQLPDGIGAQWHRRRRWLERCAGYRIERLSTPSEIAGGMEILIDLHRKRWALEGGSDAFDGARVEGFHRDAAPRLAALGWARIFVLHAEGAPRAALYGFRHGDRFAFYQAGHEPAWRPRSVGTVLLGHVMRESFAEGIEEFDFLRGDEPYKLRWATGWRETMRVSAHAGGLRARLREHGRSLGARLKRAGKEALPPEVIAWARAQRRALTARLGGSR